MKNWLEIEFSNFAIYRFILTGILIFFIFRFLKFLIPIFFKKKHRRKTVEKFFPIAELTFWLAFFGWAIEYFLAHNQLFALGVFVILIFISFWISMYVLKDIIAGVVFKAGGMFSLHEMVAIGDYKGKICNFGQQSLELETEAGQTIFIPYSVAMKAVKLKVGQSESLAGHSFELKIPKKKELEKLTTDLKTSILNLPWSSLNKMPVIKLSDNSAQQYTLKLTVYALDEKYFYRIESYLREKYV